MSFSGLTGVSDITSNMSQSQHPSAPTFLTLLPAQSSTHQQSSPISQPSSTEDAAPAVAQAAPPKPTAALSSTSTDESEATLKARRSSSVSTASSEGLEKKRFLMLGPVHSDGDPGDSEIVVEE
ncbi:MAG: hypothetical protein M1830_004832 [Pleopsidium flavum]|nr:MAG: hypothetical protein M1830_004832 [Pleopsidium flavum]